MQKRIKGLSIATSVLSIVYAIFLIVGGCATYYLSAEIAGETMKGVEYVGGLDGNDPSAGFEALGGLGYTAITGMLAMVLVFVAIMAFAIAIIFIIQFIVGMVALHKYKVTLDVNKFKADGILKTVFGSIFSLLTFIGVVGDFDITMLCIFVAILALLIMAIVMLASIGKQNKIDMARAYASQYNTTGAYGYAGNAQQPVNETNNMYTDNTQQF